MKILLYLKINQKYNNFEAHHLLHQIKKILENDDVEYSTSIISNDYDLVHFINLDDLSYYSLMNRKKIKKVASLLYSEEDIYGSLLTKNKDKETKDLISYQIAKSDIEIINSLDMVFVPTNEAKNVLVNFGAKIPIEIVPPIVNFKKYQLENSVLKKAIYSYFELNKDKELALVTLKFNDTEGFLNLKYLLEKFSDIKFVVISQLSSKRFLNLKINNIIKNHYSNLIFTSPLSEDIYNSLLFNAKYFISLSSHPGNVMELGEALASKTQIFALNDSSYNDILIDKKTCYLYNNIELLRIGIEQYRLNLIDPTIESGYEFIKEYTLDKVGPILIKSYQKLMEENKDA